MTVTEHVTQLNKVVNKWIKTEILGQITYLLSVVIVGLFGIIMSNSMSTFYKNYLLDIAQQLVIWTSIVLLSIASFIAITTALRRLIPEVRKFILELMASVFEIKTSFNDYKQHFRNHKESGNNCDENT